jgi:site-specific DNA recombinase
MEAVIYTRVSRDAKGERVSVQSQERECLAVCERNGWPVRAVYCDNSIGASRYSADRPEWRRLKGDLQAGDVLVVWESSRAQRDLEEFITLRNLCADLGVPLSYQGRVLDLSEGDDRFTGGLDALLAERESEQIRTRVLRGKRESAAKGKPSTRPPWGYRRVDVAQWEPDPVEAPRIRKAVERLLAGDTQYSVLEWLRATDGYSPASPTMLRRALLNPALAGLRVHQGEVTGKAAWEPIITEDQHRRLVARSKHLTAMHGQPGPEPKYLLTGIAMCGVCGDGLRYYLKKGRVTPCYVCYRGHVSRPVPLLDKAVEGELFKRLSEVDPSQYESHDLDDSAVIAEIDDLEGQLIEWEAEAIAGRVSPGAFGRIEQGLRERIESLRATLVEPSELELDPDEWPDLPMAERRRIVRGLFRVVVPKLERWVRATPGDVVITPI